MIQQMLEISFLVHLASINQACMSGSFWIMYSWSLTWMILRIIFLAYEMSTIVWSFEYSLSLLFFGVGMKTDLFQSCGHFWGQIFQICWRVESSTFTASSFRIWNSSNGILSPPLALLVVRLPQAHLISYSRMSGSRWVTTPSWLSESWRSFLYSSVFLSTSSYYLLLLLGPYHFCPLSSPSLHEVFPWYL